MRYCAALLFGSVVCRSHTRDTKLDLEVTKKTTADELCQPSLWDEWVDTLDCMWQNPDEQWWYSANVGHARGSADWENWNGDQTQKYSDGYTLFQQSYYYDQKHQKVCDTNGNLLSIGKISGDQIVADCNNPSNITGTFSDVRHQDARQATMVTAINFASIYDDKTRQGTDDAAAQGHPEWSYGEYINYDHLPAKSTYPSWCNGGSSGGHLPTVAIQAVDHKGPVWTYCTTSRSSSSDNDRKSIAKMIEYSANGEYGRSIFENLDCLLAGALDRDMTTTFTDYIVGFKNLMYLHYEAHTINQAERDILLSYLTLAQSDPESAYGNVDYFDGMLKDVNTDLTPKFCD